MPGFSRCGVLRPGGATVSDSCDRVKERLFNRCNVHRTTEGRRSMHPGSISHLGQQYALGHLGQHFEQFDWCDREEVKHTYAVRVRYSSHCYSEGQAPPYPDGSGVVRDGRASRIFCPIRHGLSESLPQRLCEIFRKPGTQVGLTHEANWSIYWLNAKPALEAGHRYCVFFRLKKLGGPVAQPTGPHQLDLFVESAYSRARTVPFKERIPFGKVAERIARS